MKWHETCKCEFRLNANVCNNKQRWNDYNVDANVNNLLIKVYLIKNMLGILVIVNTNVINHVMLVKIVSVEKGWQIN